MSQCQADKLSCCHQRYLACKQQVENDKMLQLMIGNREPTAYNYMGSLYFEKLNARPDLSCTPIVASRGNNGAKREVNLFNPPNWLLKTNDNTFVNGAQCKSGVCCYQPTHQTFMNLSKQMPF